MIFVVTSDKVYNNVCKVVGIATKRQLMLRVGNKQLLIQWRKLSAVVK